METEITKAYFEKNNANYFEDHKWSFARTFFNGELTTEIFGHVKATLFNSKSDKEATMLLAVYDEDTDTETEIDIAPEVAYWLGKSLIDFAENAVHINHFYNQNDKADE